MLKRLFEQGELVSAIEQGFAEYKKWQDKSDLTMEQEFWDDVKANGVLRHLVLSTVVVDDIKMQVLLSLSTESEGNLEEHGICIALQKDRWRFHQGDYFSSYTIDIQSKAAAKLWKQLYPASSVKTPVESDPTFLYGTWEFDKEGAKALGKRFGKPEEVIRSDVENYGAYRLEMAPQVFNITTSPWNSMKGKFVGVQKRGNHVAISVSLYAGGDGVETMEFVYEDHLLKNSDGLVLKRIAVCDASAEAESEEDTSFIYGRWDLDPKQTEALLRHRGVSETRIKVELQKRDGFSVEISCKNYSMTIPDGRGGKKTYKFPFGACSQQGHAVTVSEQEKYYHQGNFLAQITSSLALVYRKAGTADNESIDCEKVCKMFTDVKTKPGL